MVFAASAANANFTVMYRASSLKEGGGRPLGRHPTDALHNYDFPTESRNYALSAHNGLAGPQSRFLNGRNGR